MKVVRFCSRPASSVTLHQDHIRRWRCLNVCHCALFAPTGRGKGKTVIHASGARSLSGFWLMEQCVTGSVGVWQVLWMTSFSFSLVWIWWRQGLDLVTWSPPCGWKLLWGLWSHKGSFSASQSHRLDDSPAPSDRPPSLSLSLSCHAHTPSLSHTHTHSHTHLEQLWSLWRRGVTLNPRQ